MKKSQIRKIILKKRSNFNFKNKKIYYLNLVKLIKTLSKDKNSKHKLDQLKFNEKIDELIQETDILLDEIDKWQM